MKTFKELREHIVKSGSKYKLVSKKSGKNLGTYDSKAGAEKRERQVQYFKHMSEDGGGGGGAVVRGAARHNSSQTEQAGFIKRRGGKVVWSLVGIVMAQAKQKTVAIQKINALGSNFVGSSHINRLSCNILRSRLLLNWFF